MLHAARREGKGAPKVVPSRQICEPTESNAGGPAFKSDKPIFWEGI
jgi:hypothetical protein